MGRALSHEEIEGLLGAFALDALEPGEADAVRGHLTTCPHCRAEVADHRETAALLAYEGAAAPAGVWSRIQEGIGTASPPPASVPFVSSRRQAMRLRVAAVALAVALAATAALGFEVTRLQSKVDAMDRAAAALPGILRTDGLREAIAASLSGRHATRVTLSSPKTGRHAEIVLLPDGTGFLLNSSLARLPASETYQLWGILDGKKISLGILGPHPTEVPFTIGPHVSFQELALTVEPRGGVVSTSSAPVAAGRPVPS